MAKSLNYFAIRIEPTAPVILGRRLNLDALLAYLLLQRLYERGIGQDEALHRAHSEIPLSRAHSVYTGSSALIPRTHVSQRTMFGSVQRHIMGIDDFPNVIAQNPRVRANSRPYDRVEKVYQTITSTHQEYHLHRSQTTAEVDHFSGIWFAAYGDRAAIEDLIGDLRYIGKKRTPIRPPEFFDAMPSASPGLLGHDGSVLRPVPCESDFVATIFARSNERCCPPYWRSSLAVEPTLCYVPARAMYQSVGEIKRLVGV